MIGKEEHKTSLDVMRKFTEYVREQKIPLNKGLAIFNMGAEAEYLKRLPKRKYYYLFIFIAYTVVILWNKTLTVGFDTSLIISFIAIVVPFVLGFLYVKGR